MNEEWNFPKAVPHVLQCDTMNTEANANPVTLS